MARSRTLPVALGPKPDLLPGDGLSKQGEGSWVAQAQSGEEMGGDRDFDAAMSACLRSAIPGLIEISEVIDEDGKTKVVFEIEDDKADQFYTAFGLQTGDDVGLRRVLIKAIEMLESKATPPTGASR